MSKLEELFGLHFFLLVKCLYCVAFVGLAHIGRLLFQIRQSSRYIKELQNGNEEYCETHKESPKGYLFYFLLCLLVLFIFFVLPPVEFP